MAVEVVEKKKGTRTCADCGTNLSKSMGSVCENCGSSNIKKSLIVIRKETGDDTDVIDDLDFDIEDEGDDPDEDDDDLVDDEDGEELQEEDEDELEEELVPVGKSAPIDNGGGKKRKILTTTSHKDNVDENDDADVLHDGSETADPGGAVSVIPGEDLPPAKKKVLAKANGQLQAEVLGITTALAEQIIDAFSTGSVSKADDAYETAMTTFNDVMDAAANNWRSGDPISKSSDTSTQMQHTKDVFASVIKAATEGGVMPKVERPSSLDGLELPDDARDYIGALEEATGVSKKEDIYKGLHPDAAEIVRKSAEIIERDEVAKWQGIADSLTHTPGDKVELAKSLRALDAVDSKAAETQIEILRASDAALAKSDVFKSFGRPGTGEPKTAIEKRQAAAKELVEKGTFKTIAQAEVHLMEQDPAAFYEPTNA